MAGRPREFGIAFSQRLIGLAERLARQTNFTTDECRTLLVFHAKMETLGALNRKKFQKVLVILFDIVDDVMLDLVFHAFDRDRDGYVDDIEWVRGLSMMLRGTIDELIEFVYYVYDINGDRSLSGKEIAICLKGCFYEDAGIDEDEMESCERDIVEIAMTKLDVDDDNEITFEDFKNAVMADPLILPFCGPCLPSDSSAAAFLGLITQKYQSYTSSIPHVPKPSKKRMGPPNWYDSMPTSTTEIKIKDRSTNPSTKSFRQPLDKQTQSMTLSMVNTIKFKAAKAKRAFY